MVSTEEQSKRNKRLAIVLTGIFVVMLIGSTVLFMLVLMLQFDESVRRIIKGLAILLAAGLYARLRTRS